MKKLILGSLISLLFLSGCGEPTDLDLKGKCAKQFSQEQTSRFPENKEWPGHDAQGFYDHQLTGIFYSKKLNTCISKWSLRSNTMEDGGFLTIYYDAFTGGDLRMVEEYTDEHTDFEKLKHSEELYEQELQLIK